MALQMVPMLDEARPVEVVVEAGSEAEDVRRQLLALRQAMDRSFLAMGKGLVKVRDEKLYLKWKYRSLEEYCREELDVGDRQARTWVHVYQRFVLDLQVKEDRLLQIGATKLAELSSVVTSKNIDELFAFARTNNVSNVRNKVNVLLGNDGLDKLEEDQQKATTLSIPVVPSFREAFNEAIELGKKETGSNRNMDAVEAMVATYISEHGNGQRPTVAFILTEQQHEAWEDTLTEGRKAGFETIGAFVTDMARAWRKERGLPEFAELCDDVE